MKYIVIVLATVLTITGIVASMYYKQSQNVINNLSEINDQLREVVEVNENTITSMKKQAVINKQRLDDLSNNLQEAELTNKQLTKIFQDHDLTFLAESKPGLIERRINEATKQIFDSIMLTTSSH